MNLNFLDQLEIRIEYQVVFWYTFSIERVFGNEADLLNEFIHSNCFKEYGKPAIVRQSHTGSDRFLQGAFVLDNLDITHFRRFTKEDVMRFFVEYSKSDSWRDDREDFISLVKELNERLSKEPSDHFYLISKDWYKLDDPIVNVDSQIYTYYFLVMWLDRVKKVINVCEWNSD
jgi:hypothetical protein